MSATENPISHLTEEQSWRVLGGCRMGRLVTAVDRVPEIFPVNFALDGHDIIFRSAGGTKLFAVAVNASVAFEVDGWDGTGGWSVIARGTAERVDSDAEIDRLEELPLRPWVPTVKTNWVRIKVTEITGRQFRFGPEPDKQYSLTSG